MKSSLNWNCAVPVLKHCYGGYHSRETKDILGGTKSWGTKKLLVPTVVLMGPSCLLPSALTFVVQPTTKVQYALLNLVEFVEIYAHFGGPNRPKIRYRGTTARFRDWDCAGSWHQPSSLWFNI